MFVKNIILNFHEYIMQLFFIELIDYFIKSIKKKTKNVNKNYHLDFTFCYNYNIIFDKYLTISRIIRVNISNNVTCPIN
jgi:hypothetical protein